MPNASGTTEIGGNCGVVARNNYGTTGTLTRATVSQLNSAEMKALFTNGTQFHEIGAHYLNQFEMNATGLQRNGWYDWLMSSKKQGGDVSAQKLNFQNMPGNKSLIIPYILGLQKGVLSTDHWKITKGYSSKSGGAYAANDYTYNSTTHPIPVGSWDPASGDRIIRVRAPYGQNFVLGADWFLVGKHIFLQTITGLSGSAGYRTISQWKILDSKAVTEGGVYCLDVAIELINSGATTVIPGETAPGTVLTGANLISPGLVLNGPNNVQNAEYWCANNISVNTKKLVPFFMHTYRWGRRTDSQWEELIAQFVDSNFKNEYYEKFINVPLAEMNAMDELIRQRELCNLMMFGLPIMADGTESSNGVTTSAGDNLQTIDNWKHLKDVNTFDTQYFNPVTAAWVSWPTSQQLVAKKANLVGIIPQLQDCTAVIDGNTSSRVIDLNNQPLGLDMFYDALRQLNRSRNDTVGRKQNAEIDVLGSNALHTRTALGILRDWKLRGQDMIRLQQDAGENELGFSWTSFRLSDYNNIKVNLVSHPFFEDLRSAFNGYTDAEVGANANSAFKSGGNQMYMLDLGSGGTIYPSIIASKRQTMETGKLEDLQKTNPMYQCIMEHPTIKTVMNSETVTMVVDKPANSLVIGGINDDIPTATTLASSLRGVTYTHELADNEL